MRVISSIYDIGVQYIDTIHKKYSKEIEIKLSQLNEFN